MPRHPAELGPRALGGRSILAAPTAAEMKAHLNEIKNREGYRPVAPICLVSEALAIFHPGVASAISWGRVPRIWSRNRLFERHD
ncbi:carbamoyltransferase C-terminal domain-containing protein [Streptomyces sp. NPDC002285]